MSVSCLDRRLRADSAPRSLASSLSRRSPRSAPGGCSIPKAGRILDQSDHPRRGHADSRTSDRTCAIPAGAQVIDLSQMTVMPGLVEAHNHLALTYKPDPENNIYYYTYVQESTALRAIQAASNGIQMLASGFTIVRDMGNNALLRGHGAAAGDRAGLDSRADDHQLGNHHRRHGRSVLPDARDGEGAQHRLSRVSRRRHAGRDRQGGAPERAVRRAGDQDLRGLQAVRLHRRRDPAVHPRGGEGRDEGRRPRADGRTARGMRSKPASGRSRTRPA